MTVLSDDARGNFPMERRALQEPPGVHGTHSNVLREISNVKEIFNGRVLALEKEIRRAHEDLLLVPSTIDRSIKCIEEVIDERFGGVVARFEDHDNRHAASVKESKDATDKAVSGVRELFKQEREAGDKAITKQEAAFSKQIDTQVAMLGQVKAELEKRIDDLKTALTTIQAMQAGRQDTVKDGRDQVGMWLGVGGFIIGIFGVVAAFLARTAS